MNPSFLTFAEVLKIQRIQAEHFGGDSTLRDRSLLESALAMPESSFGGKFLHLSLFSMAAAYAYHISENQAFVDGNKRTGLAAALVFLDLNGIEIHDPKGRLYEAMMDIASRKLSKAGLAALLAELANAPRKKLR
ncbi:MAG: type II toxin-antitoxin system death-on-curing family toxin [Elusimicrobia bacterium]|nr:type II toxin-antitoxin system death-on-curing family toxin [Elusimicrobiota bacterium]